MTVSVYDPRRISAGNGVTTVFDAPFVTRADDLQVILVNAATGAETVQTLNTQYTVANVGNQAGSIVTMLAAPAAGFLLDRKCNPYQTQETHFVEGELEPASSKEASLDRIVQMVQALTLLVGTVSNNTVHVPYGEAAVTLPAIASRKGKALTFDSVTGLPAVASLTVASFFFLTVNPITQGLDNDAALNTVTGDVFLKTGGVWTLQGNLRGPTGVRGSINFTGATAPGTVPGAIDNDTYLQTAGAGLGDYYKRVSGAWVFQANLRGASGTGTGDVVGPAGAVSDRFALFDGTTGKLIKAHTGAPGALATKNTIAGASDIDAASITYDRIAASALASTTEVIVGSTNKLVSAAQARLSLSPVPIGYAASVVLDLSGGHEFDVGPLTGPINLAAPVNAYIGQPIVVWLTQDATGGRAITVSSTNWKLGTFTPSIGAGKVDMIKGVIKSVSPFVVHGSYQSGTQ